ncbi:UDP-2,3-diacylglucosamine diphosphatase [Saccharicrinis sp. FJH2]|uniref:UDP-2,3-diacylglucosamine diphosphatase n=1 Tax=Saccharicrinis sp. FJH65 TaxID=3344659 RepID=UPI0035F2D230
MNTKKIYFASDLHLGAPYITDPKLHEKRFVDWLTSIQPTAKELFLLGDIFDFWWEYKRVVPRGFVRLLGKLAEFSDSGIPVHFFIGNHDIWLKDYLEKEIGMSIHREPTVFERNGLKLFLAHGDGLNDTSLGFRVVRGAFHSKFLQKMFETFVHPDLAIKIGQTWSNSSRKSHDQKHTATYLGEDKEHLVQYAKKHLKENDINFYVFGHRHITLDLMLTKNSRVIILGDWITHFSFGSLEDKTFKLEFFGH